VREPSAAERDFHARAMAALAASLPRAPAGTELPGGPYNFRNRPAIGVMCKEDKQKEGNFSLGLRQRYFLKQGPAEYQRLLAEHTALKNQIDALEALPPEVAAEREQLNKKRDAAYSASMKAAKERDKAAEQALNAESNALDAQSRALRQRHVDSVKPQTDALRKRQQEIDATNAGQEVTVGVAMNVARLPSASASNPVGAYGVASPAQSAGLKVHNVVWSVTGPAGPLRHALADAIDRARLQAMVGKPLPAEAESEALAAKAVPAALGAPPPAAAAETPAAAPVAVAAAPAPAAASAAQPEKAKPDATKQAADAVNKLRGLFGR
jgi:hypothetical protein